MLIRIKHTNNIDNIYQQISESYYNELRTFDSVDEIRDYICNRHVPKEYRKYWYGASINKLAGENDNYAIIHYVKHGKEIKIKED